MYKRQIHIRADELGIAIASGEDIDIAVLAGNGTRRRDVRHARHIAGGRPVVQLRGIHTCLLYTSGQDAVNAAQSFNEWLDIDGVMLTKLDGDARGGAALSVKAVTGKPIKFAGTGEKIGDLEVFHPDRMASRCLLYTSALGQHAAVLLDGVPEIPLQVWVGDDHRLPQQRAALGAPNGEHLSLIHILKVCNFKFFNAGDSMKFYVTRHGQTAWNRENLVCGITDLPLDETGREQARQTAQKLKDTHLDRVIVSPLLRARQTAELICQGRALPLSVDARVREQNYGIYEGVSRFDEGFLSHKRSFATRYPGGAVSYTHLQGKCLGMIFEKSSTRTRVSFEEMCIRDRP